MTAIDICRLSETHAALAKFDGYSLDALKPATVNIQTLEARDEDLSYCGNIGWIRFQSSVRWAQSLKPEEAEAAGPPIAGEWIDQQGVSRRLFPDQKRPGRMMMAEIGETNSAPDALALLRQDVALLIDKRHILSVGAAKLRYAVFWRPSDDGAVTRYCDMFLGIGE